MQYDKRNFGFVLACARLEICTFHELIDRRQNECAVAIVSAKIIRELYRVNIIRRSELSTGTFDKVITHTPVHAIFLETFFIENAPHESRIQRLEIGSFYKHHRKIPLTGRIHLGIVTGTDSLHARGNRREHIIGENHFLHFDVFAKIRRSHRI